MSEEKLYAVKNDEGKYWDFYNSGFWRREFPDCLTTTSKEQVEIVADEQGGHVVTLVEEPEKVVLTKEQAEIVENAHGFYLPAEYISINSSEDEEELLMNAYVNGYTVEKEKKYNIKVPKKWSGDDKHYWTKEQDGTLTWACLINKDYMISTQQFTAEEIKKCHLDGLEKVEVEENGGLDK